MSKTIKYRKSLLPKAIEFLPSRRWLLKIIGFTPAMSASQASDSHVCDNHDELLQHLEREILSAYAIVDHLITRQGLAEQALWKAPSDFQHQIMLDAVDRELVTAHEHLAQLIAKLSESPAATLNGLQVKARLMSYNDEIAQSLCEDILALPRFDDHFAPALNEH